MSNTVKIYKVTVPSIYAYPTWNIILKICYSEKDAKDYISSYPNPFIKSWLSIEVENISIQETDQYDKHI